MKTILAISLAACGLLFAGCATATQKNAGTFLSKVAAMNITASDISQHTTTPIYSHSESVSGISKAGDVFTVTKLYAEFTIPLWGVKWDFSAAGISGSKAEDISQVATAAGGTGVAITSAK